MAILYKTGGAGAIEWTDAKHVFTRIMEFETLHELESLKQSIEPGYKSLPNCNFALPDDSEVEKYVTFFKDNFGLETVPADVSYYEIQTKRIEKHTDTTCFGVTEIC